MLERVIYARLIGGHLVSPSMSVSTIRSAYRFERHDERANIEIAAVLVPRS